MKIGSDNDKGKGLTPEVVLLALLPYLYILSVSYCLGFWGPFAVNVFDYYAVTDLAKGVISPIIPALVTTAIMTLAYLLTDRLLTREAAKAQARHKSITAPGHRGGEIIAALCIYGFLIEVSKFLFKSTINMRPGFDWRLGRYMDIDGHKLTIESNLFYISAILCLIGYRVFFHDTTHKRATVKALAVGGIFFVCFLPGRAYLAGKESALLLLNEGYYQYAVLEPPLVPQKKRYKYLGKAGEHYILLSLDNLTRVAISTEKLDPLQLTVYAPALKGSVKRARDTDWHLLVESMACK